MDTYSKYTVENPRLCRRVKYSTEENKDSNTSVYAIENQKSSQIVPNTDIIQNKVNQHSVCEVVDRWGNIVIPQDVVDSVQSATSCTTAHKTHTLRHNIDNSYNSVTKYNTTSTSSPTSLNEQTKICLLETDIIDKIGVNEQTIKSEEPCSYMPQMQPSKDSNNNDTTMFEMQNTSDEKKKSDIIMLPSPNLISSSAYKSVGHHRNLALINSSFPTNIDIENIHPLNKMQRHKCSISTVTNTNVHKSGIIDRLCPEIVSLPSLPTILRNGNTTSNSNVDSTDLSQEVDSANAHPTSASPAILPGYTKLFSRMCFSTNFATSIKLSATTKSYLMILVLLFISNMAGKKRFIYSPIFVTDVMNDSKLLHNLKNRYEFILCI